jgi:hypothetical protein
MYKEFIVHLYELSSAFFCDVGSDTPARYRLSIRSLAISGLEVASRAAPAHFAQPEVHAALMPFPTLCAVT